MTIDERVFHFQTYCILVQKKNFEKKKKKKDIMKLTYKRLLGGRYSFCFHGLLNRGDFIEKKRKQQHKNKEITFGAIREGQVSQLFTLCLTYVGKKL